MNHLHEATRVELPEEPFIWRDVSWHERHPLIRYETIRDGLPTGERHTASLGPGDLFPVLRTEDGPASGMWCNGFAHAEFDEDGAARFRQVPCPKSNRIAKGQQCPLCLHLDRFRPIHRAHRGAQLTEAARTYVDRPHWLYVATFPDGSSKVGTAHERSKTSRLDQQAVACARYVALARDGRTVRDLEDAVSRALKLTQVKRVAAKLAGWLSPLAEESIVRNHERVVSQVRDFLDELDVGEFSAVDEPWRPGEFSEPFMAHVSNGTMWEAGSLGEDRGGDRRIASGSGPFLLTGPSTSDPGGPPAGPEVPSLMNMASVKNRACRVLPAPNSRAEEQIRLF